MSDTAKTLASYITNLEGPLPPDDLVHMLVPLFRQIADWHEAGKVADLSLDQVVMTDDGRLSLPETAHRDVHTNYSALSDIQPSTGSALKIVGEYRVERDGGFAKRAEDANVLGADAQGLPKTPVFVIGYESWESRFNHHDPITDIFVLGQILASLACQLNFDDESDVKDFALSRGNLFALFGGLNPVIATLIEQMTALNRHDRATDLNEVIGRLESFREQPVGINVERVLADTKGVQNRRTAVLSHLRDRLFDLSRRNRLLHFRPTQASVNFTEASIPIVMRVEAIKADQLCTWSNRFEADVLSGKPIALGRWLRFEDQPYLKGSVDRILSQSRRDKTEFGFSTLRLIIAFFNWRNLKDAPKDPIRSPLLSLPVTLVRKKGVRDQYVLTCQDPVAEVNPALRHYLRQLYNIELPETVDLEQVSLADLHRDLADQIARSEPNVRLELVDKPAIELIHQRASQRVQNYNRRRGIRAQSGSARPSFSYDADDYRPLGQVLFEQTVRPSPLPQRSATGVAAPPRPDFASPAKSGTAEAQTYSMGKSATHQYDWSVDLTQVTLANLNYKKMSLVRDYNDLIDGQGELPSFDRIFSVQPKDFDAAKPADVDPDELWGVVPSDATQTAAIALARGDDSFIIQGPPGTGKSQTITNLIADFVAQGKRVLFVCEKRAALDVVFHRLKQVGLDRLSTLVHDSQDDKREFVMDLKEVYEGWAESDHQSDYHHAMRDRTLAAHREHFKRVEAFEAVMQNPPSDAEESVREILHRRFEIGESGLELSTSDRQALPGLEDWDDSAAVIERIEATMKAAFGLSSIAEHVFARLNLKILDTATQFENVQRATENVEPLTDEIEAWLERDDTLITEDTELQDAGRILYDAHKVIVSGLAHHLDLLDEMSPASAELVRLQTAIAERAEALQKAALKSTHWSKKFEPDEARRALDQARQQEGSLLRFFSGKWHKLSKAIKTAYDFSAQAIPPSFTECLEDLVAFYEAQDALHDQHTEAKKHFGVDDFSALVSDRGNWMDRLPRTAYLRALRQRLEDNGVDQAFIKFVNDGRALVAGFEDAARGLIADVEEMTLAEACQLARDMREELDDLPNLLPALDQLATLPEAVARLLRNHAVSPDVLEAAVVDEAVQKALRDSPALREMSIEILENSVRRVRSAQTLLNDQNAEAIIAGRHVRFADNMKLSMTSVSQLDAEQQAYKKTYSAGRRELENEFRKSMRYKAIRELADGESGQVVRDIKPIWLMSPLSVSDTLPLMPDLFDVVVFDEASQIPMEDAVPALCRAPQVIVVGDEMQLPPTSFFSAALDEDDLALEMEEEGERISIILDADSLLSQSARTLPATLLSWHYRSRSESLISFSNAAFYDGRLTTIPDVDYADEVGTKDDPSPAQTLLARPITYHKMEKGVYSQRSNAEEARYIAELVRELLIERKTDKSLGIVAFSEAQQDEIETALASLAGEDKVFSAALEEAYVREDDDQFVGLFIKNLENVQGDERDIIILSICYGPDSAGKFRMNFGPINQRGGEKRLNVIFSRAKHHMAVVSSIEAEQITNVHNDGARALKSFLAFATNESSGAREEALTALTGLNPDARRIFARTRPDHAVRQSLAEALRERGHVVDEWVGNASLRCDLALRGKDGGRYTLGILIDRDSPEGQGRQVERYVFQPGILEVFGWRMIDVPSSQWFANPERVLEKIEAAIVTPTPDGEDFDPFKDAVRGANRRLTKRTKAMPDVPKPPKPKSAKSNLVRELHYVKGTSNKFWRVEYDGCDLIFTYGRIGSDGQTTIKTYASVNTAKAQAERRIEAKRAKGYVEIDVPKED